MQPHRALSIRAIVPVYLTLIVAVPAGLALRFIASVPAGWRPLSLLVAIPAAAVAYVLVAGALSRVTLGAIVGGRFPRDLDHEIYGPRRLYALCWTSVYCCAPIYHAVLAVPALKWLTFRLFGYRGSLDFQAYSDTLLRDLPLLSIGKGAYLSNKATISPNMCLRNGKIIVMPVSIGAGTLIGHLTMIAPGVTIGDDSEVGVGAQVGVRVRIGSSTLIDHACTIDHDARIGDSCMIGSRAYIGRKAVVRNGLRIPPATIVPAGRVLTTQADVDALVAGRPNAPATHLLFASRATKAGILAAGSSFIIE